MASIDKLIRITLKLDDKFSGGMDKAAGKLSRLSGKMTSVGKAMTLGVTLPLIAIGAAAAKTAIDFEEAFTGVTKTVEGTTAQMEALRGELEALATSGKSPVSSLKNAQVELFKMAEAAGQLGVAREDIAEFVDVMGQLAMSTNIIGDEGAIQLARFANVTKFDLSGIRNLGDVIVDLGNNLATTEAEILTFGQRMGTLADVGLTADEILAWGGALSSLGIQAEAGGTNFVRGVRQMAIMAAQGGKSFDALADVAGSTSEAFKQLMSDDPTSAMQQFISGLSKLSLDKQVAAIELLGLKGERVRRVFLTLAGNTELVADALDLASEAMAGNGALLEEASKRAATTAGQLNLLRNNIAQLANELGEALLPAINSLVQFLIPLVQSFTNLPPSVMQTIVVVAALVTAIGPLLFIGGKVIALFNGMRVAFTLVSVALPAMGTAITAMSGVIIPALTAALSAFGAALAVIGLPIVVVTGALAALAVAYKTNFLGFKTFVDKIASAIKFGLERAFTALKQLAVIAFLLGKKIIGGLIEGIKSKVRELIITVLRVATDVNKAFTKAFGIKSPSKETEAIGEFLMDGLRLGMTKGFQRAAEQTKLFAEQTFRILAFGDFKGTGSFYEDSAISNFLFNMRGDYINTASVVNQSALQMQLAGQRLNQLTLQRQQQTRSVLQQSLRRVATATRSGSLISGAAVSRIQQQAISQLNRGAQAAAASLNQRGFVSGRGGSGFVSGRGGSGFVSGRGGSGNVSGFNVNTMNINVPPGTTREQVDLIMREMSKQATRQGASRL